MKNILVPTDFSPEAHAAFEVALQLAQRVGGTVTLLHVLPIPAAQQSANFSAYGGPVNGAELPNSYGLDQLFVIRLIEVNRQKMQALVAEAAQLAPNVPVHDLTDVIDVDDAILKVIEERHIELVVLGTQHHSSVESFFSSSNTEQMVRLAPCPVLSIKQRPASLEVRNIIFPSDFSTEADSAATGLKAIQQIFPDARLHLLHITDDDQAAAQQQIAKFAERHQLANAAPVVAEASSTSSGIEDFARKINADLIVMPTHARTGLSRFFQGSVAEDVATHAETPVLTFHL